MILSTLVLLAALSPAQLAQQILIADTHIDAPSIQAKQWTDLKGMESRDFSYSSAKQGGLNLSFMSVYTSPTQDETGTALQSAQNQMDAMEALAFRHPDKFYIVRNPTQFKSGDRRIALTFGMENAAPMGDDPSRLAQFAERGVSYITLAHSGNNRIADSSYAVDKKWNGLSPLGRQVVGEMNRLGIMVDVSHLSDDAALQATQLSTAPVIASHSAFRHFTPGFERNISDDLAKAIAAKGGVIHVTFGTQFVNAQDALGLRDYFIELKKFKDSYASDVANGIKPPLTEAEWDKQWDRDHPAGKASVKEVADHIEYGVKLVGIDHIGIGSDFDGVGDYLPDGLKTAADYPNLIAELRNRKFTDSQIRKIMGGNTLRVWRDTYARRHK